MKNEFTKIILIQQHPSEARYELSIELPTASCTWSELQEEFDQLLQGAGYSIEPRPQEEV